MQRKAISKTLSKTRILEPLILFLFWLLLFASPVILGYQQTGSANWNQVWRVWQSFIPYLFLFLLNRFFLLPFLFFRNRKWLFLIINALLIGLLAFAVRSVQPTPAGPDPGMRYRDERMLHIPREGPPPGRDIVPLSGPEFDEIRPVQPIPPGNPMRRGMPFFINFILVSILMVGFETGLALTFRWTESEQLRMRREKESISNQLAFLRNQISPHFFMNTLNNIHALIDLDTEKAKDTLIQLSKLMRHLLYDAEVATIPLEKELRFVANYVSLMELRFDDHVQVELILPQGDTGKVEVPPLMFTTFIENAFKYGLSSTAPSFVRINFDLGDEWLVFRISNSVFPNPDDKPSTGIGIANTRKRLDLLYGDRYSLKIGPSRKEFQVCLKIPV